MSGKKLPVLAALLVGTSGAALAAPSSFDPEFERAITVAKTTMVTEPQKAYGAAQQALDIASKAPAGQKHDLELITGNWLKAESLTRTKRPAEALPILDKALAMAAKSAPGTKLQGDILKSRGHATAKLGNVQSALNDFQSAFNVYQTAKERRGQAMALQEIGSIYTLARDYKHQLDYYAQARDVFPEDPILTLSADNNRGDALKNMGKLPEAEAEFRSALAVADQLNSGTLKANILANIAFTEALEEKDAAARADAKRGLTLAAADPEARSERPFLLGVLAKVAAHEADNQTAANLLDQVFTGVDPAATPMEFRDFHELASTVFEAVGDREKALVHLKAFKRLDDQGRALAASTNAALVAAKFDFANQATKIAELKFTQAQSRARFTSAIVAILLSGGLIVTSLITHAFFTMRRSRNKIRVVNIELEDANSALGKALKAKTEFLATTSHEIRTPLNGILGMAQVMLADSQISAQTRERLGLLKTAGDTMNAMVNDLLDVAKIENGALSVEKGKIDLHRMLDDTAKVWRDQAQTKGLVFTLDTTNCPRHVIEDGDRLRQVLFNLLSNAIKFTETGRVSVTAKTAGENADERLIISVEDSGIGIPDGQLDRVFESFTQVDSSTARQYGGTGLGLTICRNIATALGGTVTVQSQLGHGSTFTICLPLERAVEVTGPNTHEVRGLAASNVLVLDDNLLGQAMVRAVLSDKVRNIEFVSSVDAALKALSSGAIDCLLVDGACLIRQEPTSAFEAVIRLASASSAPICAVWPGLDAALADRLLEGGAARVVAKPAPSSVLLQELAACIETVVLDDKSIQTLVA